MRIGFHYVVIVAAMHGVGCSAVDVACREDARLGREIPSDSRVLEDLDGVVTYAATEREFPSSVVPVGDINGDGVLDFAVWADRGGRRRTFVIFGGPDLQGGTLEDAVFGGRGLILGGEASSDQGRPLGPVGDVNGDGLADIALGGARNPLAARGRVYLVFGRRTGGTVQLDSLAEDETGFVVEDVVGPPGEVGVSVATAGDIDGDGRAETLVAVSSGEEFTNPDSTSFFVPTRYNLHLVPGRGSGVVQLNSDPNSRVVLRSDEDDGGAITVVGGGDLDGDGRSDFAIGDPVAADARGRLVLVSAAIFEGSEPQTPIEAMGAGVASLIEGIDSSEGFGRALANIGDLDGDGLHEVATIVRWQASTGGDVSIVRGAPDIWATTRTSLDAGDGITVEAEHPEDAFDYVYGGDVDGDGQRDLITGSLFANVGFRGSGAIYLLHGSVGGDNHVIRPGGAGVTMIASPQSCGRPGGPGIVLGDVTADGIEDFSFLSTRVDLDDFDLVDSDVFLIKGRNTW